MMFRKSVIVCKLLVAYFAESWNVSSSIAIKVVLHFVHSPAACTVVIKAHVLYKEGNPV
jgi:hypothetical protein